MIMGEFMEQMLGGGRPLVDIEIITGDMIPGLGSDLVAGADPVATDAALSRCQPRMIPAPHREYGHLIFGVATHSPRLLEREDAIRSLANIVGDAHRAPAFGSSLGDVPVAHVAAVLVAGGFRRTAAAWVDAVRAGRAAYRGRHANTLVWDVPGEHEVKAVALKSDGHYCAVDFSASGERVVGLYGLNLPEVPSYRPGFERRYGSASWSGLHATRAGAERLRAALTAHCGAPRELRILGLDE
jgi:hypothetical protein